MSSRRYSILLLASAAITRNTAAFMPISTSKLGISSPASSPSVLYYDKSSDDDFDLDVLHERIEALKVGVIEEEFRRPPGPEFSSQELVNEVILGLQNSDDPLPDSGARQLLRVATTSYRNQILKSIGAGPDSDPELAASALSAAMSRPLNQYALLIGEAEDYTIEFPSEPVDFGDGKCWVECRLFDKMTNELLVVTGWDLVQREDGAWLVSGMDWQDFRDAFRPGIGREEWMRICG